MKPFDAERFTEMCCQKIEKAQLDYKSESSKSADNRKKPYNFFYAVETLYQTLFDSCQSFTSSEQMLELIQDLIDNPVFHRDITDKTIYLHRWNSMLNKLQTKYSD